MAAPRRPRLFFSFRSPYSWLTIHRLRLAVPDAFDSLDWFPYWDPDERTTAALQERQAEFHYVQMSRAKHLYLLMDTKRLAEPLGLKMAWPIDVDCWWELPHLAFLAARREGRAPQFYDAIVAARWGRGEDICTPEVVRAAAVAAGVDPDLAVGAAADASVRAEAADCLVAAYEDDVFGIPYLRWGRHRFWGYDRLDGFLGLWQGPAAKASGSPSGSSPPATVQASQPELEPEPEPEPELVAAYDTDTAGGCG